ncbi:MAG: hypothetical protein ABSH15_11165 [Verrucomicrobiota bacterium]
MTTELSNFAARLRETILSEGRVLRGPDLKGQNGGSWNSPLRDFNRLALELFALQFKHNAAYRKICEVRGLTPGIVEHWTQIPAVPTSAFRELELTCLVPNERTVVFHSSGTTEQKPSRHFHNAESLKVYEASLQAWFRPHLFADKLKLELQPSAAPVGVQASACGCGDEDFGWEQPAGKAGKQSAIRNPQFTILTPPPKQAPHSSLVHMFETVRQKLGGAEMAFVGKLASDGSWTLDFAAAAELLSPRRQAPDARPLLLLGTAFSFVHLLDFLAERNLRFDLPAGSRVMETGGYKNRSRSMPKTELHQFITERLGVPPSHIICEYGMSELSSQAYDGVAGGGWQVTGKDNAPRHSTLDTRHFRFPPWARVQVVSPETGREVADGETGLIRVLDLANVFSVMAIQTEDLGIRRDEHFELIGRATLAEARGCSLMTAETRKS